MFSKYCTETKGIVLITAIGLLVVMGMVGSIAGLMSTTNTRMGGNDAIAKQAFYAAEAGTEEARARLRLTAGANQILDNAPSSATWATFIGTAAPAQNLAGYEADNSDHALVASLDTGMDYTVAIRHKVQNGNVMYWGDPDKDGVFAMNTVGGENVYVITGYGTEGAGRREIEIEAYRMPPPVVPGAIYVEEQTTIMGSSTHLIGLDTDTGTEPCGEAAMPGLATSLPEVLYPEAPPPAKYSVVRQGAPGIKGDPDIIYEHADINVKALIDTFKSYANFDYTVSSATLTGTAIPGPGDDWGTPTLGATLEDPSTCDEFNIVHYDTQGTYLQFSGGVTGCGLLLVEGDLMVNGGFSWYGVILVNGAVVYAGGGDKQVTGGILTETSADIDVSIGGRANIVYCSDAINGITIQQPLISRHWKENLG